MQPDSTRPALPHASIAFIGPFQSGTSTLVGHMMYQLGAIDQRTIDKFRNESALIGKASYCYSWVTDTLKHERELGATYHLSTRYIQTKQRRYTTHTVPGSADHIKMMICGTALSDFAVLVLNGCLEADKINSKAVSSRPNVYWRPPPKPWERNVSQLKEQLVICQGLGIKRLIIAVSQMDKTEPAYSQERFESICKEAVQPTLRATGFSVDDVPIVPVSGFMGQNLTKPSENMPWYTGKPLWDIIESLPTPLYPFDLPLRMVISDVYTISGIGTVVVGRVESGIITAGQTAVRMLRVGMGQDTPCRPKTIEHCYEDIPSASAGYFIGLALFNERKYDIMRGSVLYCPNDLATPPKFASKIQAKIKVFNVTGTITAGKATFSICCGQQTAGVVLEAIESIEGKNPPEGGKFDKLVQGDLAVVSLRVLSTAKHLIVEKFAEFGSLGRILLRDKTETVAIGAVLNFEPKIMPVPK